MERTLEEWVSALEKEVAHLKQTAAKSASPWWEQIRGAFKNDPVYDEIVRLGEEWRRSQPIPEDVPDIAESNSDTQDNHDARTAMLADKSKLRRILEEQDKATGYVLDLTATPQQVRQKMIDQGIRPEDNSFTSELLRMRYGDDYEVE